MAGRIFISYRREDSAAHARSIELALKQAFGADQVFMDVEDIAPGDDFSDALSRMLKRCKVMLVVIGPDWLRILKERETAHFQHDSLDYIRMEIGEALREGKRIIPVLVEGAQMPDQMELYGELMGLARHQAVELRHGQFGVDMEQLVKSLARVVGRPLRVRPWHLAAGASVAVLAGAWFIGVPQMFSRSSDATFGTSEPTVGIGQDVQASGCTFEPFSGAGLAGGSGTMLTITSNPAGPCQIANTDQQRRPISGLALRRKPRWGEVTILPSGVISYMPNRDYVGSDHFAYHAEPGPFAVAVMVRVMAAGQAMPRTTLADFDGTCNVAPFQGAALPGGSTAVVIVRNTGRPCAIRNIVNQGQLAPDLAIVRLPLNGEAQVTGEGYVAYTPRKGFTGRDYFAYNSTSRPFAVAVNIVVLPAK